MDRWWRVYLDMDVAREWGVEATAAVLLHEVHHVVRDHHGRADRIGVRHDQATMWNLAGDAAINDDLVDDGLPLPDPVLPAHLGLEPGLIEEAYFRRISADMPELARDSCGSGSGGPPLAVEIEAGPEVPNLDGLDDVDAGAIRRSVAHDVVRAADRKQPVSPGLVRWARDLLHPQVPWQTLLRSKIGRSIRTISGRSRPDWTRPDRRSDSRADFPHPGRSRHSPDIAVVIDTSASMSGHLLDLAVTEVEALLHRAGVRELTVVVCDANAVRPQKVRRLADLSLRGGGGTDLRVGITAAARCRPSPSIIVVLTDGLTPWPSSAPPRTQLIAIVIGEYASLPSGDRITALRIRETA